MDKRLLVALSPFMEVVHMNPYSANQFASYSRPMGVPCRLRTHTRRRRVSATSTKICSSTIKFHTTTPSICRISPPPCLIRTKTSSYVFKKLSLSFKASKNRISKQLRAKNAFLRSDDAPVSRAHKQKSAVEHPIPIFQRSKKMRLYAI